ncbi:MAG: Ig-like domain-containing protein, partial [Ilumatobacteraceae bacterium]
MKGITTMRRAGFNSRVKLFSAAVVAAIALIGPVAPASAAAPTNTTKNPLHNATGVAVNANLVLTFSEAVTEQAAGIVSITPVLPAGPTTTLTLPSGAVTGSGTDTITINPPSDLATCTQYEVQVSSTAFRNGASEPFTGIGPNNYRFTTVCPVSVTAVAVQGGGTPPGAYGIGQTIPILVGFAGEVTVTNDGSNDNIKIRLSSLPSDGSADISYSGTRVDCGGTNNCLLFNYTVASEHTNTPVGQSLAVTNLSLSGAATLAVTGFDNRTASTTPTTISAQLGQLPNYSVNTALLVASNITTSTANGSYRTGNIDIVVTFNQATTIADGQPNPALVLNSGQNVQATYLSSNGDNTQLTFRYAVASPQNTPPNNRLHVTAIQNSASLRVGGQPAVLAALPATNAVGSLSANKELFIDTTAPVIFGASPPPGLPIAPIVARTANFSVFLDGGEALVFVPTKNVQIRTVAAPDTNVQQLTIPAASATITTARAGTTVTVTLNGHGYSTNDVVSISGVATPSMNGTYGITVVDANSFTYTTPQSGNVASNAAGVAVKAPSGLSLANGQLGINFATDLLGPTAAVTTATRTGSSVVYT